MCECKIGVPGPQSVEQVEVTIIKWQYLGDQDIFYEYTEVWHAGKKIASETVPIGIRVSLNRRDKE